MSITVSLPVGEEWVYQLRDSSPLERVQIIDVLAGRRLRYVVLMLTGPDAGKQLNIPDRRLKVPWVNVAEYAQKLEKWTRVSAFELTKPQEWALGTAFELCIPSEIADPYHNLNATGVTMIFDRPALETLTGRVISQITDGIEWFDDGDLVVSAEGGLRIAEAVCRQHSDVVLKWVHSDEEKRREACRRGRSDRDGADQRTDPRVEWAMYLEYDRHVHELLRQWCGYAAISARERLLAAETEAHRLDELLSRCVDALRRSEPGLADSFTREQNEGRITPGSLRPVVERPADPPVVEYRSRRWPR